MIDKGLSPQMTKSARAARTREARKPTRFLPLFAPRCAGPLGLAACALLSAAPAARAEDSQPLSSRMLQMLGLGGESAAPTAPANPAPTAPTVSANPAPAAPASEPTLAVVILPSMGSRTQNRVLRMLGLGGGSSEGPVEKAPSGLTECPDIVVDGAGAELRAPAGAAASDVSYQIAIARMARECALNGNDISVRVGLLGAAMLGPAGRPGAYFGNVRVALRRKSDDQLFGAKNYRVGATIGANESRGDFTLLVESISAPFISAKAGDDYEVVVGFAQGGGAATIEGGEKKRRKHKRN